MAPKRILVIGNYPADGLQSMDRFADLLVRIYQNHSKVSLALPPVFVTRLPGLPSVVRKYLAYIDKLVIFPIWLMLFAQNFDLIHVADHGNAYYSFCFPRQRCIVTCHDLLAVFGAMGDHAAGVGASPIGIWLQRLIVAGLRRSGAIAFDSQSTFDDFHRLGDCHLSQRQAVIHIPFNAPFTPEDDTFELTDAEKAQLPTTPYLLMVGSSHPRKNRLLSLRLLEGLGTSSPYSLVFAGAPLIPSEKNFINKSILGNRLITIVRPSHALLNHLYCNAYALLFPSLAEGFGWPLIEAQACGCPVIASNTTSIPEVAGPAALYARPSDLAAYVAHVKTLEDPIFRSKLIQQGFENIRRFSPEVAGEAYRRFVLQ